MFNKINKTYRHIKTNIFVNSMTYNILGNYQYVNYGKNVSLSKEMVEDSNEWEEMYVKNSKMKYKHKKSGIAVEWDTCMKQYTNRYSTKIETDAVWLNKDMVEDSEEWVKVTIDIEEIKQLQNIPCLSINDITKVYVTANRFNDKSSDEYAFEKQGRQLLEIVKEKLNK